MLAKKKSAQIIQGISTKHSTDILTATVIIVSASRELLAAPRGPCIHDGGTKKPERKFRNDQPIKWRGYVLCGMVMGCRGCKLQVTQHGCGVMQNRDRVLCGCLT